MGLYPFQIKGVEWLVARPRAYLADVMGLGKTIQSIAAAKKLGELRPTVICPASMVGVWHEEFETWYPEAQPTVRSYDWTLRRAIPPSGLYIIDEAHYLKNERAKRTGRVLDNLGQSWRWFLSGTPTPNGPHELYTIVRRNLPKTMCRLGIENYYQWLNTFCNWYQGDYGPRIVGAKNVPLFRRLLFDTGFMLRRKFEDVGIELPKLDLQRFPLPVASEEERIMINDLGADAYFYVNAGELPPEDLHMSSLRRLLGEIKAQPLAQLLAGELKASSHKLVVFAYHLSVLDTLQAELGKFGLVRVDGSRSQPLRDKARVLFQTSPSVRVFLGQIQASGVGITLTAASDIMIAEPSWVPSENDQAISRVRRIGQPAGTVTARMATIPHTLDDALMRVIMQKQRTITTTIDKEK